MKKFLCLLLIALMITPGAIAETFDLSSLSFDQLRKLQQIVNQEIVSRPEWKEATVPAGTWTVGEDIPEGSYSIRYNGMIVIIDIEDQNGNMILYNSLTNGGKIGKVKLVKGYTVELSDKVIFAQAETLGF